MIGAVCVLSLPIGAMGGLKKKNRRTSKKISAIVSPPSSTSISSSDGECNPYCTIPSAMIAGNNSRILSQKLPDPAPVADRLPSAFQSDLLDPPPLPFNLSPIPGPSHSAPVDGLSLEEFRPLPVAFSPNAAALSPPSPSPNPRLHPNQLPQPQNWFPPPPVTDLNAPPPAAVTHNQQKSFANLVRERKRGPQPVPLNFVKEDVADLVNKWHLSLVGASTGDKIFYKAMERFVIKHWTNITLPRILRKDNGLFVFHFFPSRREPQR